MTQAIRSSEEIKLDVANNGNITKQTLEEAIQIAVEQARSACETTGASSSQCAVAWDIVEELQAEKSHRQAAARRTGFDVYCEEHPEASECLIYDV